MMREDWIEVELGDVCGIHDTLRRPINSKERNSRIEGKNKSELFPYYGATGQVGYIDGYLTDGEFVLIGEDGAPFFDYTKDIAYLIKGKTWVNNHAHILLSHFNNKFLLHYLNQFNFYGFVSGTTRLKLTQNSLKQIPVHVAPLPEQRAIAAKIEQLFSELDNGIANLKTAKSKLEIYRFCVLNLAIVNSPLQKIANVVDGLSQGWSPKCREESSKDINEWAVIKTSAIQSGNFIEEENKILPDNLTPREQHEIKVDDILITRAGPRVRVGICCLVRKTRSRLINCDKVYRLRVKNEIILPTYFEYLMNSLTYVHKIEEIKTGGNDSGLNLTQVRYLNIEIPIPPIEEQKQIVQEIETRLSVCDKLNESIDQSLEKAQALRQSILKKAFEGKLLSEDELQNCRQQPDWEPAAKLLERVKKDSKTKKS